MPIENYYWFLGGESGSNGSNIGGHFIDMTRGVGTWLEFAENTGALVSYETGAGERIASITPRTNSYSKARSGNFTFLLEGAGSGEIPDIDANFYFYNQQEDAPKDTVTKAPPQVTGGLIFQVKSFADALAVSLLGNRNDGPTTLMQLILLPEDFESSVGSAFRIEWLTNQGSTTPLSSDPANPSLPELHFRIWANTLSRDTDALVPELCAHIPLESWANFEFVRDGYPPHVFQYSNWIAEAFGSIGIASAYQSLLPTSSFSIADFNRLGPNATTNAPERGGQQPVALQPQSTLAVTDWEITRRWGTWAADITGYIGKEDGLPGDPDTISLPGGFTQPARNLGVLEPQAEEFITGRLDSLYGWIWNVTRPPA